MPSHRFKIEVYGIMNYGCPDYDLMGYNDINELLNKCWNKYYSSSNLKKESQE